MGIILRPDGNLQISFTDPTGRRIRRSAGTRDPRQAQELHDKLKAEAWRIHRLGDKPQYIWQQAVLRWLDEHSHKASIERDKLELRYAAPRLDGLPLAVIDADKLEAIAAEKAATGVAPATVNRLMQCIRSVLRCAERWGWIDRAPMVRLRKEPVNRVRWLTRTEADRLLKCLPPHLAAMMRFTLATGLRETNVTRLRWDQIDLSRRSAWIHADQAKARRALAVPLNDEAVAVLRGQVGQHPEYVFAFRGQPVLRANNTAWRHGLAKAGIENFRWHDLRHTWASWHAQAGTPLHVLQELGGWASYSMVLRYAHLSSAHLLHYSRAIDLPDTILPRQTEKELKTGGPTRT